MRRNWSVHQTEARSPRGWGCIVALDAVNTLDPLDDEDLRNRRFLMRYLSRGSTASRGSSATCPVSPPRPPETVTSSTPDSDHSSTRGVAEIPPEPTKRPQGHGCFKPRPGA